MYGAEYRLQCVGNYGGKVGISQSLRQVGPTMITQEHKEHRMQVCQDLLNQYDAEGDIFLDRVITGDEAWYLYHQMRVYIYIYIYIYIYLTI